MAVAYVVTVSAVAIPSRTDCWLITLHVTHTSAQPSTTMATLLMTANDRVSGQRRRTALGTWTSRAGASAAREGPR